MERITQSDLERQVVRINKATGSPVEPYTRNGKKGKRKAGFTANVGNYHLDYAYGGVRLVKMTNPCGGITNISPMRFGPKRELYNWMDAFLAGMAI